MGGRRPGRPGLPYTPWVEDLEDLMRRTEMRIHVFFPDYGEAGFTLPLRCRP
jgi:hypothetical protein